MEPTFKVPIRNVFYMLSYVNNMPDFIDQMSEVDDELITYDFLAKKLNKEVRKLLSRGLIHSYVDHVEETGFISGRLLINESIPLIVERKPRMVCEKDDYSENILLNQILKNLYQNTHIHEQTRNESFLLWEKMPVHHVILTREIFHRLTLHRHNVHYKRALHVARLLFELQLLSHQSGDWSLYAVDISETELNRLFEGFLFHFYRMEQQEYRVKSERFPWHLHGENQSLLPTMLTDVSLIHRMKPEKIIMDAKFYRNMFQTFHDKNSFHSHNMYQLFTYLMHQSSDLKQVRGILVYPYNGQDVYEVYEWSDRMTMEVMTVNLGRKWEDIFAELMSVFEK